MVSGLLNGQTVENIEGSGGMESNMGEDSIQVQMGLKKKENGGMEKRSDGSSFVQHKKINNLINILFLNLINYDHHHLGLILFLSLLICSSHVLSYSTIQW